MSNDFYVENAKELVTVMLDERRKLVEGVLQHGRRSTDDLTRLRVINQTIELAEAIQKDERDRVAAEEYKRHEAAGTLVEDGYGGVSVPQP